MNWLNEFADAVEFEAPLGRLTWFRLGGPARYLVRPRDVAQLSAFLARANEEGLPVRVLGTGANVLISDAGFDGAVIRLNGDAFRRVEWNGVSANVGAGVDLMPFARECSVTGLSGLECMAGIPATVGGAVRMNAGGRFGDIARVVRQVELLRPDGTLEVWPADRIGFGYRHSALTDCIVVAAQLLFDPDDPGRVKRRFNECFDYKQRTQPMADRSAGCIFKNPKGRSAGALIDRAGLKGTRCGLAWVSRRHANFIVTAQGASASDVMRLIEQVGERVHREFGTLLELEVEIWRGTKERRAA